MSAAFEPSVRDFLERLARAAFASPFGAARWRLDAELTNLPADDPQIVPTLVAQVTDALDRCGPVRDFPAPDRELLRVAAFFEAFHRFADHFDTFIARQRAQSDPLPFDGHEEVAALLHRRGVDEVDVPRAFELFYQFRRAFVFLNEALVGDSPSMRRLKELLWNQLFSYDMRRFHQFLEGRMQDFSLMLVGGTGTGKSAAAAALGRAGFIPWTGSGYAEGFNELFLPVNLSELPGTLLESALFGHERGAFTGAIRQHRGVLGRSSPHGVVFLDEIGEVDTPAQIKLLRVLQERTFTPLGATEAARFEGRVVAATLQPIEQLLAEGKMREDFYYRLCSDVVEFPTLAQRLAGDRQELRRLVDVLVTRTVGEALPALAEEVEATILRDLGPAYPWPGNVRELEQCVRRVLLTSSCGPRFTTPGPVDGRPDAPGNDVFWRRAQGLQMSVSELLQGYAARAHVHHGSYESAARALDIDRRTLKKYAKSR